MSAPTKLDRLRREALGNMGVASETDYDMRDACVKDAQKTFNERMNQNVTVTWEKSYARVSVYRQSKLVGWFDVEKYSKTLGCWFQQ